MDNIFVNTATGNVSENMSGIPKVFSPILAGGSVSWRVQFVQPASDGTLQEYNPDLVMLRACVGYVDVRPVSGSFRLRIGSAVSNELNTTAPLSFNADPLEVEAQLNSLASKPDHFLCDKDGDSFIVQRRDGQPVQLDVVTSELIPTSIADVRFMSVGGRALYNIRLKRAPIAFYNGIESRLPNPPIVTTMTEGYYSKPTFGPAQWANEIQRLYVPPEFKGSYLLKKPDSLIKTQLLNRLSGISDIQTALNKMGELEYGSVIVTNPEQNVAFIEFKSSRGAIRDGWGAIDIPTLEVEVFSAPPPNYEITLNFSGPEIARALGDESSVTLMFECEGVERVGTAGLTRVVKYWSVPITIKKSLMWDGLATEPFQNWQERLFPKNYIPFTQDQVLIGQQQAFTTTLNNQAYMAPGIFSIDHNLSGSGAANAVVSVSIHEIPTGRRLRDSEYDLFYVTKNSISITIPPPSQQTIVTSTGASEYLLTHRIGLLDYDSAVGVALPGVTVSINGNQISSGYTISKESEKNGQARIVFSNGSIPAVGAEIVIGSVIPSGFLKATVIGYGPASAFQAHTHTINQIISGYTPSGNAMVPLSVTIDNILQRIASLESVGKTSGTYSVSQNAALVTVKDKQIILPSFGEILPDVVTEGSGTLSIASQLSASAESMNGANVGKPQVIEGTDLAAKQKEMQAQFDKYKADKDAEVAAMKTQLAEDAKKKAAETVKVKAASESKTLNFNAITVNAPAKRGEKYGLIMPAVSSLTTSVVSSLPSSPASGVVYECSAPISIPGGGGRKVTSAIVGDKFCFNGGIYYPVSQSGGTYHPKEMEVDLFRFMVSDELLSLGTMMDLVWNISFSFQSNTIIAGARYNLNVYATPVLDIASPAGPNMGSVSGKNKIFTQKIILSRNTSESRKFQLTIINGVASDGKAKIATELKSYGKTNLGPDIVASQFLINVRLEDWDVDDSTELPSGQVSIAMLKTSADFVSAEVTT